MAFILSITFALHLISILFFTKIVKNKIIIMQNENFEILNQIDEGAFGIVYKAKNK